MKLIFAFTALFFSIDKFVITEKLDTKAPILEQQSGQGSSGQIGSPFVLEPDRFTGPIEWDLDALATVKADEPSAKVIGFAPAWCQMCPLAKATLGNGDHDVFIEWRTEESYLAKAKFADGSECGYPCLYFEAAGKVARGNDFKTVDQLKATFGIKPTVAGLFPDINAGTISKEFVDHWAEFLGPLPSVFRTGNDKPITFGSSVTITIPRQMELSGTTSGSVLTVKANPKPTISWMGVVSQQIDGGTYDGKKITIVLPGFPSNIGVNVTQSAQAPEVGAVDHPRSSQWPSARRHHLEKHPACEACGKTSGWIEAHHIKPFHEHPELELEESNLITLCRDHHFRVGHDPDGPDGPKPPNWSDNNPNVRRDAAKWRETHSKTLVAP